MAAAGRYINRSGTPVIRNTGTIKRTVAGTVELYPAVENDGLIEGVELEGGGTGSTRRLHRRAPARGDVRARRRRALTNVTLRRRHGERDRHRDGLGRDERRHARRRRARFHVNGPFTWSGGTMGGTGTTRVTSTLTHTANTSLNDTRVLADRGHARDGGDGRYINRSGTPVVRNTGTIKRTAAGTIELYAALDNDGRVENVELEGGGSGSTGEFAGVQFHSGTFELDERCDVERT